MHGYELKQNLKMLTGHFRPVSDGALYPAISRLTKQGLIEKRQEEGKVAAPRQVLSLTKEGNEELILRLKNPSEKDISDRNHFFTYLSFLKYLETVEQIRILQLRLKFLNEGRSFFQAAGKPVPMSNEDDLFRKGMLHIAKETSRVERDWLKEMINQLENI